MIQERRPGNLAFDRISDELLHITNKKMDIVEENYKKK